jgi:hypothetical protein
MDVFSSVLLEGPNFLQEILRQTMSDL